MFELISLFGGFITSGIPYIFKYFQDKQDKAHELQVMQMQIQASKEAGQQRLEEIQIATDSKEFEIVEEGKYKGGNLTDSLNAGVPAVYAYSFLFLYVIIQVVYTYMLKDVPPGIFADLMWTDRDQDFLQMIVGHYFGRHGLKKVMGR